MSALLNMNQIRYVSWKGKTLDQVVPRVQKNKNNQFNMQVQQFMQAQPLKLYRKEIASKPSEVCNTRTSIKIDSLNMPGSTHVSESPYNNAGNGLVGTLNINEPTTTSENPPACGDACIFSPEMNARRRVRSAGMIPKKYNVHKNNDQYHTSTKQY